MEMARGRPPGPSRVNQARPGRTQRRRVVGRSRGRPEGFGLRPHGGEQLRLEDHGITIGSVGTMDQRGARNPGMQDTTARRRRRRGRRPVAGSMIVLCALVASLVAADYWVNAGEIYRGVSAGSVSLGGETPGEARKLLEDRAARALAEIRLTGPERSTLDTREMSVDFDAAATAESAYAVGRRGGLLERVGDRARAAFGTARVAPEVEYRPGAARAAVEDLAARVSREPRSASVVIRGAEAEVIESAKGYDLDVPATVESVDRAIRQLTGEARMAGEVRKPKIATGAAGRWPHRSCWRPRPCRRRARRRGPRRRPGRRPLASSRRRPGSRRGGHPASVRSPGS